MKEAGENEDGDWLKWIRGGMVVAAKLAPGLLEELTQRVPRAFARWDEPLREHVSFSVGGPCDLMLIVGQMEELQATLSFCHEHDLPWFILGRGSNLLVPDSGVHMIVIKLAGEFTRYSISERGRVLTGAAVPLATVARACATAGWKGLEFAAGIPGSLGGGVIMNAGAYEGQMSDVVERVEVLLPGQSPRWLESSDLAYTYRKSKLQDEPLVVTRVKLALTEGNAEELLAYIEQLEMRRWHKQPLELPSAGSFFKRPQGHYAAALIEKAGLKGFKLGGAQVSPLHAGFIVNAGHATASDILALMQRVQEEVHEKFGVWLEPEVRIFQEEFHGRP